MMKKVICGMLALTMLISGGALPAAADSQNPVQVSINDEKQYKVYGDWLYVDYKSKIASKPLKKGEVYIYGYKGQDEKLTIPSKIGNSKVTGLSYGMVSNYTESVDKKYKGYEKVKKVTVPKSIKDLASGTLSFPNLETLVFEDGSNPKGITFDWIGYAPKNIKSIKFPKSFKLSSDYKADAAFFGWWSDQTEVNNGAIDSAPDNLVISCVKGSWAENFAKANNIAYKYTGKVSSKSVPAPAYKRKMPVSKKAIALKWCKVSAADGYKLYQYKGGRWKVIKTIKGAKITSFKVKGLKTKTTYKFKLKAYKRVNGKTYCSAASNTMRIKTK